MDDLRYPIGRFRHDGDVTDHVFTEWVEDIESLPARLAAVVGAMPDEQLDTPYRSGGWTVRQVVHHLVDSHMNGFCRLKFSLVEETPEIKAYDEARWAELADHRLPVATSLSLLAHLHARWAAVLRSLTPEERSRAFTHPSDGRTVVERHAGLYAWHGRHHLAHVTGLIEREGW